MTKKDKYTASIREIEIRLDRGGDLIGDLGNVAAILKKRHKFFWVGFYFNHGNHMTLGPFQGNPACVTLSMEKGVCAATVKQKEAIIVPNVCDFPGHVACDPASKSEITIPVYDEAGELRAILDVDDDVEDAFDEVDKEQLETIARMIAPCWD